MDTNKKQDWEQIRQIGKWGFIRKFGIIGWGIQTFIIFYIILNVFDHGFNLSAFFAEGWIAKASIYLLVFMVGGATWGYWIWSSNESKYREEQAGKKRKK